MSDRLERETNPPSGRIASPVPQYWNSVSGAYEKAEGLDGAIYMHALSGQIVDLLSLLTRFGEVQASPTTNTLLERVKVIKTELDALQAQIGEITDTVVTAGASGSVSAKLRRVTTDIGALLTAFNAEDFASQTTLLAGNVQVGAISDVVVAAGAAGSLSAKMRRVTTDLGTLIALDFATETPLAAQNIQIGDTDAVLVAAGAVGSLSAKMRRLTTDLAVLMGKDFATQTTLAALKTNFDAKVALEDFVSEIEMLAERIHSLKK